MAIQMTTINEYLYWSILVQLAKALSTITIHIIDLGVSDYMFDMSFIEFATNFHSALFF